MAYNEEYYTEKINNLLGKPVRGAQATYKNISGLLDEANYRRFKFYILHLEKGKNYGTKDLSINDKIKALTHLPSTNRTKLGDNFRLDIQNPTTDSNNYQIQKGDHTLATVLVHRNLIHDIDMETIKFAFSISANWQFNVNILYRLNQLDMDDFKNLKHKSKEHDFQYLFNNISFI